MFFFVFTSCIIIQVLNEIFDKCIRRLRPRFKSKLVRLRDFSDELEVVGGIVGRINWNSRSETKVVVYGCEQWALLGFSGFEKR